MTQATYKLLALLIAALSLAAVLLALAGDGTGRQDKATNLQSQSRPGIKWA